MCFCGWVAVTKLNLDVALKTELLMITQTRFLTLEEFLKLPETKPPSEYINGQVIPKPVPKTRHSRLQGKLIHKINEVVEAKQIAYGFPELRCTFGERSIIPDIAVFRWENIAIDETGEPLDQVIIPPNWTIEILSPDQSSNRVIGNILHCLQYGSELGWLIDPDDRSILVFQRQQQPELFQGNDQLVVLEGIDLDLTAEEVFNWLKMGTFPT